MQNLYNFNCTVIDKWTYRYIRVFKVVNVMYMYTKWLDSKEYTWINT